jgi:hypothetical protein
MAVKQKKRRWPDEEKRSICFQTTAAGVSVAQVAAAAASTVGRSETLVPNAAIDNEAGLPVCGTSTLAVRRWA